MADGARIDPRDDDAEQAALAEDGRLIRRVRWRLVAWSGFTTLVVLLVLGAALYAVVAGSLAGASDGPARSAGGAVGRAARPAPGPTTTTGPAFGFQPGAGNTFLFAFDDGGAPVQLGRERVVVLDGMPDGAGLAAARAAANGRDVRSVDVAYGPTTFPARLLTQRVTYIQDGQTYFLQALQDRSTEVATLQSLLVTLLVGGIVVVLVAFAFGAVYASRALVPIRQSLETQRVALRRQREFAADASHELRTPLDRHPLLGGAPAAPPGPAGRGVGRRARGHRRRGHPPHGARRRPAAARPVGLGRRRARHARRWTSATSRSMPPGRSGGPPRRAACASSWTRSPSMIQGDPARLRQLVMILVDNAVRHSPRGGEVAVQVRDTGSLAAIEVRDQGPGVRAEDMPHVFDRFWRAPGAPSGGTGLGLAIAKWIVDRHGGRIGVANRPEGGAAFRVGAAGVPPGPSAAPGAAPGPEPAPRGSDSPA